MALLDLIPPRLAHHFKDGLASDGSLPKTRPPTLALVGSRAATLEAARLTRHLAALAVQRGMVIVSGGARGIDTAAHEGAMEAGGITWLVSPGPLGEAFPRENRDLFARVVRGGGAIVTRQLGAASPSTRLFFKRNALLVALSDAVVVIQAGFPSGTLNAAKHARDFAVPLWACAAPPGLTAFAGTNSLLEKGLAKAVWRPELLFSSLGLPDTPPHTPCVQISLEATPLLNAMSEKAMHLDDIIDVCSMAGHEVAVHLLTLAGLGVVREGPPGWFRRLR